MILVYKINLQTNHSNHFYVVIGDALHNHSKQYKVKTKQKQNKQSRSTLNDLNLLTEE